MRAQQCQFPCGGFGHHLIQLSVHVFLHPSTTCSTGCPFPHCNTFTFIHPFVFLSLSLGNQPPSRRQLNAILRGTGWRRTAAFIPDWVRPQSKYIVYPSLWCDCLDGCFCLVWEGTGSEFGASWILINRSPVV